MPNSVTSRCTSAKICRTAFADEGRPVEVNEMTSDSAACILEYDFDA